MPIYQAVYGIESKFQKATTTFFDTANSMASRVMLDRLLAAIKINMAAVKQEVVITLVVY